MKVLYCLISDGGIVDFIKRFLLSDHPDLSIDISACIKEQKRLSCKSIACSMIG